MKTVAIIVAAGKGERIKSKLPKQFLNLGKNPILAHTIEKFEKSRLVDEIVVVVPKDYLRFCSKEVIDKFELSKVKKIVGGGKERQDSVFKGLKATSSNTDIVLIHDGVRPLVKTQKINKIIEVCGKEGPVIFALPVKETIKRVEKNRVITTLDRNKIWAVQTPQAFPYQLIMHAYREADRDKFIGTDDSQLVERMGITVKVIKGDGDNIKITTMDDLKIAEYLVSLRD
ncbi:MAG: 2-C-methyl-D-erythritol 4-phosphate cytidylyltransferase [candidate division Zixibacteria bacterium]|nr:2-C-methyl-D-erythritol 4-phosphate cytidylyltransferase [candidate division Zixibacteria bacterium]